MLRNCHIGEHFISASTEPCSICTLHICQGTVHSTLHSFLMITLTDTAMHIQVSHPHTLLERGSVKLSNMYRYKVQIHKTCRYNTRETSLNLIKKGSMHNGQMLMCLLRPRIPSTGSLAPTFLLLYKTYFIFSWWVEPESSEAWGYLRKRTANQCLQTHAFRTWKLQRLITLIWRGAVEDILSHSFKQKHSYIRVKVK